MFAMQSVYFFLSVAKFIEYFGINFGSECDPSVTNEVFNYLESELSLITPKIILYRLVHSEALIIQT